VLLAAFPDAEPIFLIDAPKLRLPPDYAFRLLRQERGQRSVIPSHMGRPLGGLDY
jgi:hypothetical protein